MQFLGVAQAGEMSFVLVEYFVTLWHSASPSGRGGREASTGAL
jgi:hypothetical protein